MKGINLLTQKIQWYRRICYKYAAANQEIVQQKRANADCRIFHAQIYAAATTTIVRTLIQAGQLNMMTVVKMNLAVTLALKHVNNSRHETKL